MWNDLSLPIDDCDLFVRIVPFPGGSIHGTTTANEDGTYNVYLDANSVYEKQQDAYWHEYKHIACDDFYNERPIEEIEMQEVQKRNRG